MYFEKNKIDDEYRNTYYLIYTTDIHGKKVLFSSKILMISINGK